MHSRRYFLGGESSQELLRVLLPLGELRTQIGPCWLLPKLASLMREEDALADAPLEAANLCSSARDTSEMRCEKTVPCAGQVGGST